MLNVLQRRHQIRHIFEQTLEHDEIERTFHFAERAVVLIRLPAAGCLAWKEYGVDWHYIDATRHLLLHAAGVVPAGHGRRGR